MVQKIRAATDARRDDTTVIVARTDARAAHGMAEALDRATSYASAGADVLFIEGLLNRNELATAGRALPDTPKIANIVAGGKTPMLAREELNALGYAIVLYANAALQGAVFGTLTVMRELRDHGTLETVTEQLATFSERQRLVDKDHYDTLGKAYSG
jgi:2-methylisocitrate lyase-like PEP mutase family enzyme